MSVYQSLPCGEINNNLRLSFPNDCLPLYYRGWDWPTCLIPVINTREFNILFPWETSEYTVPLIASRSGCSQ